MPKTPHKEKLLAAMANPKCKDDLPILNDALHAYQEWINNTNSLTSTGKQKVQEMTNLLNEYKDYLEVELIARRGSPFIKRQKGQLKLDNSVLEEFLIHLIDLSILDGLPSFEIETGPQTAFMSLSFRPASISHLDRKPDIVLKQKNQDFTIGKTLFYKFSANSDFEQSKTMEGSFFLAILAAECKINFDKTMFQECAGTASRLKQGCPVSKYYVVVEYLDMEPEDCRLTDIDNVFLLRHTKRLPYQKRSSYEEIKNQHEDFPIDNEIVYKLVQEIQAFIDAIWYDPDEALRRGSFV
jgi:hypothetical protein